MKRKYPKIRVGDIVTIKEKGWDGNYLVSEKDESNKYYLKQVSDTAYGTFWKTNLNKVKKSELKVQGR